MLSTAILMTKLRSVHQHRSVLCHHCTHGEQAGQQLAVNNLTDSAGTTGTVLGSKIMQKQGLQAYLYSYSTVNESC